MDIYDIFVESMSINKLNGNQNKSINPIPGACFYTLIMAHVVLKAPSVSLGHSGINFLVHNIFVASKLWIWQHFLLSGTL